MGKNWTAAEKTYDGVGTVSADSGTTVITGSGTDWPHNMTPGMGILIDTDDDDVFETAYTIDAIPSATSISTEETITASFSGKSYQIAQVAYEPDYGDVPGADGGTERCAICGLSYAITDMVEIGGAFYCTARMHDEEIQEVRDRGKREKREDGFRVRRE